MPIKGISEVVRLPRLGKIRLGIKKNLQGTDFPEPTDYFVCPDEVKKIYGEKPKELHVMFPINNLDQCAGQYLRCYSESRRLVCRGNGISAVASNGSGDTNLKEIQCHPANCNSYQQGCCRKVMNLQFLILGCSGYGIYQLDTSSYHSMVNINSSLELSKSIFGRFSMIPFSLILAEQEVQPEGQIKTAWVLNLVPALSLEETLKYALLPSEQALVLPCPDNEAPDDLFPNDNLKKETRNKTHQDEELLKLWDRAKKKIWQIDMQDYQIAHYFRKYYQMEAGLKDFESSFPPAKFKLEHLNGFLTDIEKHTQFAS